MDNLIISTKILIIDNYISRIIGHLKLYDLKFYLDSLRLESLTHKITEG